MTRRHNSTGMVLILFSSLLLVACQNIGTDGKQEGNFETDNKSLKTVFSVDRT